jgi:hypothetical protein
LPYLLWSGFATPDPVRCRSTTEENDAARDEAPQAVDGEYGGEAENDTEDRSRQSDEISVHRFPGHHVDGGLLAVILVARNAPSACLRASVARSADARIELP